MITGLTQYLENQVRICPDKCALVYEDQKFTFKQLYIAASNIALEIQRMHGEMINQPIVIYFEKGAMEYVAMLGVLCSGNYYIPLDTQMPKERLKKIMDLLQAKFIITSKELSRKIGCDVFSGSIMEIDDLCMEDNQVNIAQWTSKVIDTDPAYVLFTSGSTGVPKGVIISHRAVIDYIEWQCRTLPFDGNTVLGSQAPFYFDASVPDIYTPLKCGAQLVIIPETLFLLPNKLAEYVAESGINTLIWVPSALMTLTNKDYLSIKRMEELKLVMFCGEVMPSKHLNIWRKYYPDVMFVNLYGPTEATYACTYYIVEKDFGDEEALPIGFPCGNTDIFVLDENNKEIKSEDIEGELCIRGSCLSNGYFNNPSKTQEVFISNPLNEYYSDTIYRTGDIVKYNHNGELVYVERKDFQIKHMGYRIELGEIESAAYSLKGMQQCCAIYDKKHKKIVLCCSVSGDLSDKEIFRQLKVKIPRYMLPGKINILEQLPLNANGKIDRQMLMRLEETEG